MYIMCKLQTTSPPPYPVEVTREKKLIREEKRREKKRRGEERREELVRVGVLVIVPLERVYPVRVSDTHAQKAASGGPDYPSVAAGWLAAKHYAGMIAWRPLASRLKTGESY